MGNHYFISYSTLDASDFATLLCETLGKRGFKVWRDRNRLGGGDDFEEEIVQAIRTCQGVLFLLSEDSVRFQSYCRHELSRAIRYKKPVVPLLIHPRCETPLHLEGRHHIDFTGGFETAFEAVCRRLEWYGSPAGIAALLEDRLEDARRDLRRCAEEADAARIRADIAAIECQIEEQKRLQDDPEESARRLERVMNCSPVVDVG
jgi:hypothetical protein